MNHLSQNNLLSDNQHEFRARRSCETQLITTVPLKYNIIQ